MPASQPHLSADNSFFVDGNGKPFFYFADTFWYGISHRASRQDFCTVIDDRAKKGVNVIQIVVGFIPETEINTLIARNHWSSPLTEQLEINPAYFEEAKWRLQYIVNKNMIPCVVGGWGWHIDQLGPQKLIMLWAEIIKTLGKLPAFLCLCGEVDLALPLPKQKQLLRLILPTQLYLCLRNFSHQLFATSSVDSRLRKRLAQWKLVAQFIREVDPHHRPFTVHVKGLMTGVELFADPNLFDYDVIQSSHTYETKTAMVEKIKNVTQNGRLILNMEPAYEGILDHFWGKEQVDLFTLCVKAGAKGHAYGANGIWQMGKSNDHFLSHWGRSDWKAALSYSGLSMLAKEVRKVQKTLWWTIRNDIKSGSI